MRLFYVLYGVCNVVWCIWYFVIVNPLLLTLLSTPLFHLIIPTISICPIHPLRGSEKHFFLVFTSYLRTAIIRTLPICFIHSNNRWLATLIFSFHLSSFCLPTSLLPSNLLTSLLSLCSIWLNLPLFILFDFITRHFFTVLARYIGSMVGDLHRTLLYGGLFGYPAGKK